MSDFRVGDPQQDTENDFKLFEELVDGLNPDDALTPLKERLKRLNPKHIQAMKEGKAPLDYLVSSVDEGEARVLKSGADKYGRKNWLVDEILATTYVGAIRRHVNEWADGTNRDPDSNEHPLQHVRACCAIVMDAEANGMLIDDREFSESIDKRDGGGTESAGPVHGKWEFSKEGQAFLDGGGAESVGPGLAFTPMDDTTFDGAQEFHGELQFDDNLLAASTTIQADETTWHTVMYSTFVGAPAIGVPVAKLKSYGPFASFMLAEAFIKTHEGRIPGAASINTLLPPAGEIEYVRDRNQEIDVSSNRADCNAATAEAGEFHSEPNRNETREAFIGRWGKPNPEGDWPE